MRKITPSFICVFLLSLTLLVFAQSLTGDFILDDWYVIAENPLIKQPDLFKANLTTNFFSAYKPSPQFELNYYRPLTLVSFALDYRLWGLSPFGYRLVNVLLHFLNAFIFYQLLRLLFRKEDLAFLSAVFFVIFPIQEWTVNHIVGRGDLLEIFFVLASLLALVYYLKNPQRKTVYFLSIFFFLFGILAREAALVFFPLIVLTALYSSRDMKKSLRLSIPFFVIAAFYAVARSILLPLFAEPLSLLSFAQIGQWFLRMGEFVPRFLLPWGIKNLVTISGYQLFGGVLMSGFFVAALLYFRKKDFSYRDEFTFGFFWLFISLLPLFFLEKIILRLGPYLSEYLLYGGSLGFALMLSCFVSGFGPAPRRASLVILCAYFIFLLSWNNALWANKSEEELLKRVAALEEGVHISELQLLMRYKEDEDAVLSLIQSASSPLSKSIWERRLAEVYQNKGDEKKAQDYFRASIISNPFNIEAYDGWAVFLLNKGDTANAVSLLRESIAVNPQDSDAYRLLGIVLYRKDDFKGAIPYLEKAAYYNPDNSESLMHLAMAYFFLGEENGYRRYIDAVIKKIPQTALVMPWVASELFRRGYPELAEKVFQAAGQKRQAQ